MFSHFSAPDLLERRNPSQLFSCLVYRRNKNTNLVENIKSKNKLVASSSTAPGTFLECVPIILSAAMQPLHRCALCSRNTSTPDENEKICWPINTGRGEGVAHVLIFGKASYVSPPNCSRNVFSYLVIHECGEPKSPIHLLERAAQRLPSLLEGILEQRLWEAATAAVRPSRCAFEARRKPYGSRTGSTTLLADEAVSHL